MATKNWTFDANSENFTGSTGGAGSTAWDGASGDPTIGCLKFVCPNTSSTWQLFKTDVADTELHDLGPITATSKLKFKYRLMQSGGGSGSYYLAVRIHCEDGFDIYGFFYSVDGADTDTGWLDGEVDLSTYGGTNCIGKVVTWVGFQRGPHSGFWLPKPTCTAYVDTVSVTDLGAAPPLVGGEYTLTITGRNMDIDADGLNLYIGALNNLGRPVCIQFLAAINMDGTIVYAPAAGDWIEVACGRQDADRVWVCGNFGIPKLRLSENSGGTWATIDGAWAGVNYVRPMWPWPVSDEGITVMTHDQRDAYETDDDGAAWTALQTALPFTVGAFDMLDIHPVEAVFGTFTPGATRVELTVNNFATFHDITAGTPNYRVTKVIVG